MSFFPVFNRFNRIENIWKKISLKGFRIWGRDTYRANLGSDWNVPGACSKRLIQSSREHSERKQNHVQVEQDRPVGGRLLIYHSHFTDHLRARTQHFWGATGPAAARAFARSERSGQLALFGTRNAWNSVWRSTHSVKTECVIRSELEKFCLNTFFFNFLNLKLYHIFCFVTPHFLYKNLKNYFWDFIDLF